MHSIVDLYAFKSEFVCIQNRFYTHTKREVNEIVLDFAIQETAIRLL